MTGKKVNGFKEVLKMQYRKEGFIFLLLISIVLFTGQAALGGIFGGQGDVMETLIGEDGSSGGIHKQAKGEATLSGKATIIQEPIANPGDVSDGSCLPCSPSDLSYVFSVIELSVGKQTDVYLCEGDVRDLSFQDTDPDYAEWACYVDTADEYLGGIPPCPAPKVPACDGGSNAHFPYLLLDKCMREVALPGAFGVTSAVDYVWKQIDTVVADDSEQPNKSIFEFQVVIPVIPAP